MILLQSLSLCLYFPDLSFFIGPFISINNMLLPLKLGCHKGEVNDDFFSSLFTLQARGRTSRPQIVPVITHNRLYLRPYRSFKIQTVCFLDSQII